MQENLINDGLFITKSVKATPQGTIIVLGVARSGTSMIAAVLQKLGVFMGSEARSSVVEDVRLSKAMENGSAKDIKAVIAAYNEEHDVWAFKRPEAFVYLKKYLSLFRNPRVVVVFRDPVAIAMRNQISMHMEFLDQLERSAKKTHELVGFVKSLDCPTMVVSYEKALYNPDHFIEKLVEFTGLQCDEAVRKDALAVVENGPEQYLMESRLKFQGSFDRLIDGIAYGWARRMPGNVVCTVEMVCDGEVLGSGVAERPRDDLIKKEIGARAFAIKLSHIPARGEIEARVKGSTFTLPKVAKV
ncbi:sulfotransferase [uncultured Cohaesibacter sp.]|uniref:sulfotransferase n=1 Tax=uncultured Cohaesibacter sp. TaxID=1002546 RepID=UPI0029C60CC2|nr:sulfotransferase [uncultured Cohaesibacter sp.]